MWQAGGPFAVQGDDLAIDRMRVVYELVMRQGVSPPAAVRAYTYTSVVLYEATMAHDREYRSLAGQLNAMPAMPRPPASFLYDRPLAASAALATVTAGPFGSGWAKILREIDQRRKDHLGRRGSSGIPPEAIERSTAHGQKGWRADLGLAAADGYSSAADRPYRSPTGR
jgi:hypothetical protein